MRKYALIKISTLAYLVTLIGFQTVVHADNESDKVKENINSLLKTKMCPGCNLQGAELNRMDLSRANLQGADLTDAKLLLTNLSGANLKNAHLQRASFGGADLAGADLRGADLREIDLSGAYLLGTKFDGEIVKTKSYEEGQSETEKKTNADVELKKKSEKKVETGSNDRENRPLLSATAEPIPENKVDHQTSKIQGNVRSENGVTSPGKGAEQEKPIAPKDLLTAKPADRENIERTTVAKPGQISSDREKNVKQLLETKKCYKCDLKGMDLSGKDLDKVDLEGADLTGSNLERTDLNKANLKGALLVNANLKKADLNGADLYKANLSGADLTDAKIEKAKVDEAVFAGVKGMHR
jgi:uncharacterized protein YjbI with pentapeptide repeats